MHFRRLEKDVILLEIYHIFARLSNLNFHPLEVAGNYSYFCVIWDQTFTISTEWTSTYRTKTVFGMIRLSIEKGSC